MRILYVIFLFVLVVFTFCGRPEESVSTSYYPDGVTIKEQVALNKKTGLECHKVFFQSGALEKEYCTLNEVLHGEVKFFFDDGALKEIQRYQHGFENGMAEIYYPDGRLKEEAMFKDGLQNGIHRYYLPDGKLRAFHMFENDVAVFEKLWTYDERDSLISVDVQLTPIPVILDTVKVDQQFKVRVDLPEVQGEDFDTRYLTLIYDLVKGDFDYEGEGFPPPRFELPFEGAYAEEEALLGAQGEYIIYGKVVRKTSESSEEYLGSFHKRIIVD